MPVLEIAGIRQSREFPAVKLRQFCIVIVFLQCNPIVLLCQVFHNRGFSGIGCANYKIYIAKIHNFPAFIVIDIKRRPDIKIIL